jgi:hypothetical protein
MLSFLRYSTIDMSQNEREYYQSLLERKTVTGPGGGGKSHIVKCCHLYCKSFCDAIGKPFDFSVFVVTAVASLLQRMLHGGIHIVFIGDFMQLEPVNESPIFSSFDDIHWHDSLNGAVFLDQGNH